MAARVAVAERGGNDGNQVGLSLDTARAQFLKLPGTKSYLMRLGQGGSLGVIAYLPNLFLFVASAIKTFVLGQYLRDAEAGRLSEEEQLPIDDNVRTLISPVFIKLAGTTTARSVLEAMITQSDNMATDAAMLKVGADRVRALVALAGLRSTLIPDSTRRFFSYIFGAPAGVDLGWPGVEHPPGPFRPPLNTVETLASTANDMVSWYEQALQGAFFTKPETLTTFKLIQAMGDAIVVVPPDTAAYTKGGSFDFNDFNCLCVAGQMVVGGQTPVTFCFTVNWHGRDFPAVKAAFLKAVGDILLAVQQAVRA
jgi:beta-lactamase class A